MTTAAQRRVSVERTITATPAAILAALANPAHRAVIDGSNTLVNTETIHVKHL
jgi:hypothetical protein